MNVLVTGAEGMVGSALCHELRRRGHEVVPTDIAPQRPETLGFDVREREAGERMLKAHRPDLVIHLAAETDRALTPNFRMRVAHTIATKNEIFE